MTRIPSESRTAYAIALECPQDSQEILHIDE